MAKHSTLICKDCWAQPGVCKCDHGFPAHEHYEEVRILREALVEICGLPSVRQDEGPTIAYKALQEVK